MDERPKIDERQLFASKMFFNTVSSMVLNDERSQSEPVRLSDQAIFAIRKRAESMGIPFTLEKMDEIIEKRIPDPGIVLDYECDSFRISLGYATNPQLRVEKEDDFSLTPPNFGFPCVLLTMWGETFIKSPFGILPTPGVVDSRGRNFFVRNVIFSDGRQTSRLEEVLETDEHYDDFVEVDREVSTGDNRYVPFTQPDYDELMFVVEDLKTGHFKPV